MENLSFSVVLKTVPVALTGEDGKEKKYVLKELNGTQRAEYNKSFDIKIEMRGNEAVPVAGQNFKMMSAKEFLAMCLYDEDNKLVLEKIIGEFPGRVVDVLHKAGIELSGLNKEEGEDEAKND